MPISEHFQLQLIRSGGADCTAVFSFMDIFKSQLNLSNRISDYFYKQKTIEQKYTTTTNVQRKKNTLPHTSHIKIKCTTRYLPKLEKWKLWTPRREFQQGVQSGVAKTQHRLENVKMDRTRLCCYLLLHRARELMSGLEKGSNRHVDLGFVGPSRGTEPWKLVWEIPWHLVCHLKEVQTLYYMPCIHRNLLFVVVSFVFVLFAFHTSNITGCINNFPSLHLRLGLYAFSTSMGWFSNWIRATERKFLLKGPKS